VTTFLLCLGSSLLTMAADLWIARLIYGRWPWSKPPAEPLRFPWQEGPQ